MEGNNPLNIIQTKNLTFREKVEPQIEVNETIFSDEQVNTKNGDGERGEKFFILKNKDNNEDIGNIFFDYPAEGEIEPVFRVRYSGLEQKYRGQSFGVQLYEKLIEEAKNKHLDGIASDAAVQAGGIVAWKKLQDKGYKITVNPQVEEKWKQFLVTYGEGKLYKEMLAVGNEDSVFKILFKEQGV